jgi:CheY-like chemotaxis protein
VEKGDAVVTIRDTGIGIPQDRLDSVFDMFSQVEAALSRSRGGLGIGLSLTQKLVQMHDGSVKAYSEGLGKGSRFHVQLPLVQGVPAVTQPPRNDAHAEKSPSLKILVADDNVDAAETLGALLEVMGHEVKRVHDGEAAVNECVPFAPDVVVLDIGMPKLNGYEACRRIRAQKHARMPVLVALTGWGQEQDLAQSQAAGFDRHLVKPVEAEALEQLLVEVARGGVEMRRDAG